MALFRFCKVNFLNNLQRQADRFLSTTQVACIKEGKDDSQSVINNMKKKIARKEVRIFGWMCETVFRFWLNEKKTSYHREGSRETTRI